MGTIVSFGLRYLRQSRTAALNASPRSANNGQRDHIFGARRVLPAGRYGRLAEAPRAARRSRLPRPVAADRHASGCLDPGLQPLRKRHHDRERGEYGRIRGGLSPRWCEIRSRRRIPPGSSESGGILRAQCRARVRRIHRYRPRPRRLDDPRWVVAHQCLIGSEAKGLQVESCV